MLRKLYELGFSVIPVVGKRPAQGVKDHRYWKDHIQPDSLIEQYEKVHQTGIAVISGYISGVMFLDIDSESKDLMDLCPLSPIVKKGRRGETRIFKYNPDIPNKMLKRTPNLGPDKDRFEDEGIDFLSDGAYSVMPPSQHPDGGIYKYLTQDTLENFDVESLPTLSLDEYQRIVNYIDGSRPVGTNELSGQFVHADGSRAPHGAQGRLKQLAAGLVAGLTATDDAINSLLRYDESHHTPHYFSDKTRSDCKADPYSNASKFYVSIRNSINRDRARRNEEPQLPVSLPIIDLSKPVAPVVAEPAAKTSDFPELGGIIGMIQLAIKSISQTDQSDMALGAALAICGTLSANRFHVRGRPLYTTMYILNVAGTGSGKGAALGFINELFGKYGIGENQYFQLQGISNYSSEAAIIDRLSKQRVRLDVVDEFGKVFKGLAGGNDQKASVGECLKIMFSAKAMFNGHFTKTDGMVGRCAYPSISILGAIQPETLASTSSMDIIFDGFMGRFLYFMENTNAPYLGNQLEGGIDRNMLAAISRAILAAYPANPIQDKDIFGKRMEDNSMCDFQRSEMFESKEYQAYIRDMDMEYIELNRKLRSEGRFIESILTSRGVEHAEKIARIIAISSEDRTIDVKHIELAKSIVNTCFEKCNPTLLKAGESKEEREVQKLFNIVNRLPNKTLARTMAMKLANFNAPEMKKHVQTLTERGVIKECQETPRGAVLLQVIT